MNLRRRVLSALGLLAIGGWAGVEITLDRLGYVTTVLPFLPLAWQQKLVSEPVLLWATGLCFLGALILLASVAWKVAGIADAARKSNVRAWAFEPDFKAFKESYEAAFKRLEERQDYVEEALTKNSQLLQELIEKINGLQKEMQGSRDELVKANAQILGEAATNAAATIQQRLSLQRDRIAADVQSWKATTDTRITTEIGGIRQELSRLRNHIDPAGTTIK